MVEPLIDIRNKKETNYKTAEQTNPTEPDEIDEKEMQDETPIEKNFKETEDDDENTEIEDPPELTIEKKLEFIATKIKSGIDPSDEEKLIWNGYIAQVQAEEEKQKAILEIEEKEKQEKKRLEDEQKKKELKEEFDNAEPHEKLLIKDKIVKADPSGGKIKMWLFKNKVKKGYKKGGTLILKAEKDTGIEFIYTDKPVKFVEFREKNERGEEIVNIARVVKTKHHLKKTSVPIHIAVEGVSENVSLLEGVKTDLSAEAVNKGFKMSYIGGYLKRDAELSQTDIKNNLEKLMPILVLAILGGMCIIGWIMYQNNQQMDNLKILFEALQRTIDNLPARM